MFVVLLKLSLEIRRAGEVLEVDGRQPNLMLMTRVARVKWILAPPHSRMRGA